MKKERGEIIVEKILQMKDDRMPWEQGWQTIAENLIPWREDEMARRDITSVMPGSAIYEGSALNAYNTWVDGMYGHICSRSSKWWDMVGANDTISKDKQATLWMDDATLAGFRRFNNSNFYATISQFIGDCGGFGISHMFVKDQPGRKTVSYIPLSPIRVYVETDEDNQYILHGIEIELSNHAALMKFGKDNMPETYLKEWEENPFTRHLYYHVVGHKDKFEEIFEPETKLPYFSFYIAEDFPKVIITEGGYDYYPIITWPYMEYSGSPYSFGPAHNAIYDILGIHSMGKTLLQTVQLAADPPIAIPSEMKKKMRYRPHGVSLYEDPGRRPFPILAQSNYPVGKDFKDDKKMTIDKHFMVDFFEMLQNITARMTAYEVSERLAEKVAIIGPRVGQFTQMGLKRIIEATLHLEIQHKRLASPPDVLKRGPDLVDVDFLGSLAQAQKKLALGQGLQRAVQEILALVQFQPQVMDNVDWDEYTRTTFSINGAPSRIMKSAKTVDAERAEREKKAQAAQQAEQMEKLGNANKGLANPVAEGNILEMVGQ